MRMHKNTWYKKSLVSIDDVSKEELDVLISIASDFKREPNHHHLEGKVIASAFFEPSTRTRLSFDAAIARLSGRVIGFSDTTNTSTKKGESLEDTIRMLSAYADLIVMRHPEAGSAKIAADVAGVPLVNAGDGSNEHPTQTLLDMFSIYETQGKFDGLTIGMAGDLLHGRTVHSLAKALCHYKNVSIKLMAPTALQMPAGIIQQCEAAGINVVVSNVLCAEKLDILYMTRLQRERAGLDLNEASPFALTKGHLRNVKDNLKILHPLPRVDEIEAAVDDTAYAYYFEQAENGVYAREALLSLILSEISF